MSSDQSPFTVTPGLIHSYVDIFQDEFDDTAGSVALREQRVAERTAYLHGYLRSHAEAVSVVPNTFMQEQWPPSPTDDGNVNVASRRASYINGRLRGLDRVSQWRHKLTLLVQTLSRDSI